MMKDTFITAKARYEHLGVDVEGALEKLAQTSISIHCWQGDDVTGFENLHASLSGGIQATGNYPGKATTPEELMADFAQAISLIPGTKRINLHAFYGIFNGQKIDRDQITFEHFKPWVAFAQKHHLGIDFNPTFFSHPMASDGLTLSHPDEKVRQFWIRHGIACRKIAQEIGLALDKPVVNNVWIPDGYKDVPADRLSPRLRLKDSLDQIFQTKYSHVIDCVESKVFGIGVESYTVGSNEFYLSYAATHKGIYNLLDSGHYHPTEVISDKIPSLLAFFDKIPLHVTRPVRWDSDHVVRLEDEIKEIAKEIVRNQALDKVLIGLDFFDASINRIAAWVLGTRNMQKALLYALLEPNQKMKQLQDQGQFTELLILQEEMKTFPFGEIWDYYCQSQKVPATLDWFKNIQEYEQEVLFKR